MTNLILADDGTAYFNDMLGTTLAAVRDGRAEPFGLTAFGDELGTGSQSHGAAAPSDVQPFFTGKPRVDGLGHVFLMRNYRSELGKWLTADPLGYPDGWNQLAYCGNGVANSLDFVGALKIYCRDLNGSGTIKTSANHLQLQEGGANEFTFYYHDYADLNGEIFIYLNVSLNVTAGLWRNYNFGYGDITGYKPHTGANNDSAFSSGVYEAVYAHEYAHALSFFSDFIPTLSKLLIEDNIDSYSGQSAAEIESVIANCYMKAKSSHIKNSNEAANAHTYFWFATHKEWKQIGGKDGFDRWVKE